jgi:hypothetical protein
MSDLTIRITATLDELTRAVNEATAKIDTGARAMEEQASRVGSAFERMQEQIRSSLGGIGEVALGVFGGLSLESTFEKLKDELTEITVGGFEWGNQLKDTALATGLTTDEIQKLQFAATVTGQDLGRLQFVVNHLGQAMLQLATSDAPELRAAFKTLGLDPTTFTDAYDALTKIGDRVRELGRLSLEERGALTTIGGRGINELLPAITQIRDLGEQAERTGQVFAPEMVAKLDEANESVHRLSASWETLKRTLSAMVAGPLTQAFDAITATIAPDRVAQFEAAVRRVQEGAANLADIEVIRSAPPEVTAKAKGIAATGLGALPAGVEPTPETAEPAATTKESLQKEIEDFVASRKLEALASADTAEARIAMAQRVHDYLVSREQDAARVGIDLHHQILQASIEVASAREAASKQAAEEEKRNIREFERLISERFREHVRIAEQEAKAVADWDKKAEEDRRQSLAQTIRDWEQYQKELVRQGEELQRQIGSIFEPVANAFLDSFRGVIQGTQSVSRAFANMGQSILLEFAGSGLRSALLGGAADSFWSRIFGEQGKGGGLVGAGVHLLGLDALFGGAGQSAQTVALTANTAALTGALTSPEASSAVSNLFGQGFSNSLDKVTNLFGQSFSNISGLLSNIFGSVFSGLGSLLSGGMGILSIFGFEQGGIVPSAAGGMVTDGTTLALLHPREMVLPSDLRERVTRAFPLPGELRLPDVPRIPSADEIRQRMSASTEATSTTIQSGDVSVNVNISAIDSRSLAARMSEIRDAIGDAVSDAIRDGHRGLADLLRKRG